MDLNDFQAVEFANFDEDIESYHQELNETLNRINNINDTTTQSIQEKDRMFSHTLQRTKSKSTLPNINDFTKTEKLNINTNMQRRTYKNSSALVTSDEVKDHQLLDPMFANPTLSERSNNKNGKHHSACSYNVSSNNSFGLDEEVMLHELNDELDLDFDIDIDSKLKRSGDYMKGGSNDFLKGTNDLGCVSKDLSSKLKQSKLSLDL